MRRPTAPQRLAPGPRDSNPDGMPAWSDHGDDELRAVVVLLQKSPPWRRTNTESSSPPSMAHGGNHHSAAPTVSLSARRRRLAAKSAAPDHEAHLSVAGQDVDRGDHPDHAPLWRCRPIGQPRTVARGCRCDKPWRAVCHLRRPRRRCFPRIPCRTIRTKAHLVRRRAGGNIGPSLHTSLHPRRNDRRGCFVCVVTKADVGIDRA
jgi:hypothetical protein